MNLLQLATLLDAVADIDAGGLGHATTIDSATIDASLDKAGTTQFASLAHHGLAHAVSPISITDGDSFFTLATGVRGAPGQLAQLSALAAEAARAICNAVRAAPGFVEPALPSAAGLVRR